MSMSRFPSFNAHFSYLPYVNSGNDGMEPVVANAFTKPLRLFCVGPPFDPLPKTPNLTSPNSNDSILSFLNRAYAELGSRSVIYIAFGTISFPLPQSMDHLKIVIAEILAQVFRVVSALSSGGAKAVGLDGEYIEKLTRGQMRSFPSGWISSGCWVIR
ncbi:hypothetical protein FRC08_008584 [Ceratobasidium sp. 394]|nr:hypothetical protein FRC08_008584 [Ceratobasidium sp. 394]